MKIDKKIELPERFRKSNNQLLIEKMKIGDSVFFKHTEFIESRRFYHCCVQTFRKWKFTQRTTNEGTRVWRIK